MRNIIIMLVAVVIAIPAIVIAQTNISAVQVDSPMPVSIAQTVKVDLFTQTLQKGVSSDEVRNLQEILKSDPTIYPEGITSGYYGTLTEKAIRRLQARYNLPQTGILDDATQSIIFPPYIELTVISPNGGETWNKSQIQTISWKAVTGPVNYINSTGILKNLPQAESSATGISFSPQTGATSISVTQDPPGIAPFFPRVSIELVRDSDSSFSYFVGTTDLYQSQYNWTVPARVPAGTDYRVRIRAGSNVPCLYEYERNQPSMGTDDLLGPMACDRPEFHVSDTSDGTFSIVGETPPSGDVIRKLKNQISQMESTINQLTRQIAALKAILNQF